MIDTTPILKMLGYGAIFILIFGIFNISSPKKLKNLKKIANAKIKSDIIKGYTQFG